MFESSEYSLSVRELELLQLLSENVNTDDIAMQLNTAKETVESHIHTMLNKLNVGSVSEMIAAAQKNNWIE